MLMWSKHYEGCTSNYSVYEMDRKCLIMLNW